MIVAEDYLHLVRDFGYDPYDDPIVELHDNVHVLDDVLPAGSKMVSSTNLYGTYRLRRMVFGRSNKVAKDQSR